ncbi:hypothetical protein ACTMTJ_34610 [Phytohabitans sp. LJ34]|uniref:hypothetical protein n=1 Tax=Phytohabitans sp. LJ34 TaxID=3452217 RepID=UPI003F8B8D02
MDGYQPFGDYPDQRYRLVEQVIRDAAPDVVAVQGLPGRSPKQAMMRLAYKTGMVCTLGEDRRGHIAVARGAHDDLAVGLMWRPPLWATAGSLDIHQGVDWWYALVSVELNVGDGYRIRHGCYCAPPREGGLRRPDEAARLVKAMTRSMGLVGADWSNPHYYTDRCGSELVRPEPHWDEQEPSEVALANRVAVDILAQGGLRDPSTVLEQPRPVSTGHWPDELHSGWPVDGVLVTSRMLDAVGEYFAVDTPAARRASTHLPVGVRYDPAAP